MFPQLVGFLPTTRQLATLSICPQLQLQPALSNQTTEYLCNMAVISSIATILVALVHVYILYLEMFLYNTPRGRKTFNITAEFAEGTKVLAANQGLYNGILAAGLFWGLLHPLSAFGREIQLFFLGAVVVAGLYGGASAVRKIWAVQMLPGIIAFGIVYLEL